jgi:transposase
VNLRERKLLRENRNLHKDNERLTKENTSYREDNERLTKENTSYREDNETLIAENIYFLMEIETLTSQIAELEKKKSKDLNIKPNTTGKKKKPGRKPGFKGTSRKIPDHVDEVCEVHLPVCPECGTSLGEPTETVTHYIEDIKPATPHVTKVQTHRYYCPHCKKIVSARSPDAMPQCRLGIYVTLLAAYQKYELHLPLDKIRRNLEVCFGLKTTNATIYNHIKLLSAYYKGEYNKIKDDIRKAGAVNIDETGWRINGVNNWLWVFVTKDAVFFTIDRRRSGEVPKGVLGEHFTGVIITDFYPAYNKLICIKQKCWVHFLRDAKKISKNSEEAMKFYKTVKRLVRDMKKFKEKDSSQQEIAKAKKRYQRRLIKIIAGPYTDPGCIRLAKRLNRHEESMLTFLEVELVDYHNNTAERIIRGPVVIRKISGGNKSEAGAETHEVLLSTIATYNVRGEDFLEEGVKFMRDQLRRGITIRENNVGRMLEDSLSSFFYQFTA